MTRLISSPRRLGLIAALLMVTAVLSMLLRPTGTPAPDDTAVADGGTVLFYLDGASTAYTDRVGSGNVSGAPAISNKGRAFAQRTVTDVRSKFDSRLGGRFPYGVFGLNEKDTGTLGVYTDPGDVDPVALAEAIKNEGVYNVAFSTYLGSPTNTKKICRSLNGIKDRGLKLVLRGMWITNQRMDATRTRTYLQAYKDMFNNKCPSVGYPDLNLEDVIYAWFSYDEPAQKGITLSEMQAAYKMYKEYFPTVPVLAVYNQRPGDADGPDADTIGDGMFGQPKNPYGAGVADIVGLDAYSASNSGGIYTYHALDLYYTTARRAIDRLTPGVPLWSVAQAHDLTADSVLNVPEPHQMYRQVNDWLRSGSENGLRALDGYIWYSWQFQASGQQNSDLEGYPANRAMARAVGAQFKSGRVITHRKVKFNGLNYTPPRNELYVPATPSAPIRAARANHLDLNAGTVSFALSHQWAGNNSVAHVLFDTGYSATRNRLTIEKTAGNVLRLRVVDGNGAEKWVGMNVNSYNMPGNINQPGYSDIAATWSNGTLAIYLDGVRGTLSGGTGTGKLTAGGTSINIGHDLSGTKGAVGSFSYLTIRNAAGTATEVASWTSSSHTAGGPARAGLLSPAAGASTTDTTPTLTWGTVSRAVRYEVEISTSSTFSTVAQRRTITGTSVTLSALSRGTTYYWRVRAIDNYGPGLFSAARSFKVQ